MALTSTDRKVQSDISAGPVSSYPIPFKYWATTEIHALVTTSSGDVLLTEGVDYSVSTPGDTGTLTRLSTWPIGTILTIYRELDKTQETVLANGGVQDAELYMQMADRAVAMVQEVEETQDRIVRFPISDTTTAPDMPDAATRKGKYLGFDTVTGDPVAITAAVGSTTVSAYMATMLDDADALAAQKTLELLASGASAKIQSFVQTLLGSADLLALQKNAGLLPTGASVAIATAVQNLLNTASAAYVGYSAATVDVNATDVQGAIESIGTSVLKAFITNEGITYDKTALTVQFARAVRAERYDVGQPLDHLVLKTASADWPALRIDDADHDISATNWTRLVPVLRAEKLYDKGGTCDFTGTINTGVITFTAAADYWLAALMGEQAVHGSYTSWWSLNNGTSDYAISNVNPGARTITLASPPANGSYTWTCYPYRIPGSTTTARILKDQGNALVSAGDQLVMNAAGARRLWMMQGHKMQTDYNSIGGQPTLTLAGFGGGSANSSTLQTSSIITDGTNGIPLVGKTTHGPERAVYRYIWGAVYTP